MKLDELKKELEKAIKKLGYELYDLNYVKEKKTDLLQVVIDNDSGITIDDCVKVSHHLSAFLDDIDPIPNEYSLEVTSPGAERELKDASEIKKAVGRYVHIETYDQKMDGELLHFDGDTITINDKFNKQISFNYIDVIMIRLAIKF